MPRRRRDPLTDEQRVGLRTQALTDLRDLQRELERSLGIRHDPLQYLTPIGNRDRFHRTLDLLKRSGEDVPPWLYHHGPLYPGSLQNTKTGRPLAAVSLASLLGKIAEVQKLFDAEADDDADASEG